MPTEHAELAGAAAAVGSAAPAADARPRRGVAYELPTPEKRAWGARLREARELAGLTLTDAATALGYSQPVQLSLMEGGNRQTTLRVVVECAKLYGTTADFLCGFAADPARDPLLGAQRLVAAQVTNAVRGLIVTLAETGAAAARELRPDAGRVARLAAAVLEADRALCAVRERSPTFDDEIAGGASLVARLQLAAELARDHVNHVERARRMPGAAAGVVTTIGLATDDPIDVAALLSVDAYLRPTALSRLDLHDDAEQWSEAATAPFTPAPDEEGARHA